MKEGKTHTPVPDRTGAVSVDVKGTLGEEQAQGAEPEK